MIAVEMTRHWCRSVVYPFLLGVIVFSVLLVPLHAEDFLVREDGSSLTQEVRNTDPNSIAVDHWEIRLYGNSGKQWGLIVGRTYSSVMKQLEDGRKLDRTWAAFCHQPVGFDECNAQHPGPPTAVAKRKRDENKVLNGLALLRRVNDLSARYKRAKNTWNLLTDQYDKIKEQTSFQNVGQVIKEYTDNFKDVFKKQMELRTQLDGKINLDQLDSQLGALGASLESTDKQALATQQALSNRETSVQWSDWKTHIDDGGFPDFNWRTGSQTEGGHRKWFVQVTHIPSHSPTIKYTVYLNGKVITTLTTTVSKYRASASVIDDTIATANWRVNAVDVQ
jgi:hypothetical protein